MSRKSYRIACALLPLIAAAGAATAQPRPERKPAPLVNEDAKARIPGQYIVVFRAGTSRDVVRAAQQAARKQGGRILHTYTTALIGFSAKLPAAAVNALRSNPNVDYIEADQSTTVRTIQPPSPPGVPPTGIDRVDRRLLPLNQTYTYSETGNGVNAYVIDTGIRVTHVEFGGRASGAFTAISDGNGTNDCHGHGTNVAGIIGATTYGIAKNVTLHAVRVMDCTGSGTVSGAISGVDWVAANAVHPAVANISLQSGSSSSFDASVNGAIGAGVTVVVAAGNNGGDACNYSPSEVPNAITVGNVDPSNDTRVNSSNFGTCLDLFAPGLNILSTGNASDTATSTYTGTSQASPHVAGVAARYLETHPAATPADVWAAIHAADDIKGTTTGWPGINNGGAGSPNELLQWGSLNDGNNDGDPHLTTVDGIHYDFQSAGEFVSLRDDQGSLEIQTRQAPVATAGNPGPDPYTGLATCVSLNTAVAARAGDQRITYEPNLSGVPDPAGLQLRVDGVLTALGANGIDLADGSRVVPSPAGAGIEIDFADGTVMVATPGWWASQGKWYLNVDVFHTRATEGILGEVAPKSWLPALPDGSSLGPSPAAMHQRYVDLYQKFADAWRVTDDTSLFDYAPGTSTATFTVAGWPLESPPCVLPHARPVSPASPAVAERACSSIKNKNAKRDCVFDVTFTGETGIAKTYLQTQRVRLESTRTTVTDDVDPSQVGETVTFTAIVVRNGPAEKGAPAGGVQFTLDGAKVGRPITLDATGRATWETSRLKVGDHRVAATYVPSKGRGLLPSRSVGQTHTVRRCACASPQPAK